MAKIKNNITIIFWYKKHKIFNTKINFLLKIKISQKGLDFVNIKLVTSFLFINKDKGHIFMKKVLFCHFRLPINSEMVNFQSTHTLASNFRISLKIRFS